MSELPTGDLDQPETHSDWLTADELESVRTRLPILYVQAVPVRVNDQGEIRSIALLLRANEEGSVGREIVSGRVLYHESIRSALVRHIERDLGPMALPRIPASPQPFAVAEYFPTPGASPYYDPRQHAVALAYIVPISGDCQAPETALDLAWVTPAEALDRDLISDLDGGHGLIVRQALAHTGHAI